MTRGQPAALTGRTLGDFTVRERVGEGGHGVVYRAEQRGLGREAVVKVLHARLGSSERAVQRFLREAQLASRLDHPYAAHVYAFGAEPDGVLWIAMELVRGTPLSKVLAAQPGGRMPLARWVSLFDRICEVVHTAHEQGIVHRDLKPDNIMVLSRAGRLLPKLLDLGVARLTIDPTELDDGGAGADRPGDAPDPRLTQEGARVGSPLYMAPEQWRDGAIDGRTDLYALGVIAYEALAGRPPFTGATVAEIARAHVRGAAPRLPADLADAVDAAVRAALAGERDARPATALVLAETLRAASGLRIAADALPRLDDGLGQDTAWLPQPLAEAIGALEAARNPHQARDALWTLVAVAARWLGVVALAARSRVGPGPGQASDAPAVVDVLRVLPRRELAADEWLELTRALVRPFATARDAYPVPELLDLALAESSPFAPLLALRAAEATGTSEESLRDWLARTLPVLTPLVRALGFLTDYPVVVAQGGVAELWMGPRRARRALLHVTGELAPGVPVLVDLDGRPVLALAPLVQVAAPAPGAPEELFVFAGPGRARGRGARLVAEPHGFERHDDDVWTWFREHLLAVDASDAAVVEVAPYRGLAAFTADDAALFFGRERAAEAFVNALIVTPVCAVVGPSGAGKSSFVQAGVLPRLPAGWRSVVLRPGAAPMATFAARVGAELSTIVAAASEVLVVVVDQFEELFTLGAPVDEREQFATALIAAARDQRVRVVITLRDDFLVRSGELAALRDRLAQGLTLLATPAPDDLLRIVVEPARRAGYDFDDKDLPARMVRAVAGQPGALALLSFTAAQLWELRDRHFKRLTRSAYDAIGGVEGALAAHADAVMAASSADEQRLVRDAFRHLVTAEGTRAVLTRRELDDVLGRSPHAAAVIERLVRARLLVASESESGGDDRIEIIHEALITAWPRLVQWRRDDAEGARLRDQLRAAARQWDDRDRARGLLWRDDALDDYRRWRSRWPDALPALDEAFAAASLEDAARGRRLRRTLAATAATILIAATLALALLYRSSQHNATESHDRLISSYVEQGRRLLLDGDYLRALPYLSAAYSAGDDSPPLRLMLHRAMRLADQPSFPTSAVAAAFRGSDQIILVGPYGEMSIRDIATHRILAQRSPSLPDTAEARVGTVATRGSMAAFPADDGVIVWDGASTRTLPVPGARRVLLDPDGTHLVISDGKTISSWDPVLGGRAWEVAHAHQLRQLIWIGPVVAVIDDTGNASLVGPDGIRPLAPARRLVTGAADLLATIGDGTVEIWDTRGQHLRTVEMPTAFSGAISPDGHLIALVARTGAIELFDVATGHEQGVLAGHRGSAKAAFTPDGTRLVSIGEDRTVRIWDVADRSQLLALVGAASSTLTFDFDPGAARVVAAGSTGVGIFGLVDPSAMTVIDAHEGIGTSGFLAGDQRVFTTSDSGLTLWSATTGARVAHFDVGPADGTHLDPRGARAIVPLDGAVAELVDLETGRKDPRFHAAGPLFSAFFDRSGREVATTGQDGSIEVWDARGPHRLTIHAHAGIVYQAAFSPDGRHLASVGYSDHMLALWDVATGAKIASASESDGMYTVAFDERGDSIVTSSDNRRATLWDAHTLARIKSFEHEAIVRAAAVAADGALVAGATRDGAISIWDVASGKEVTRFHHGAIVISVDFARSGARLVSGSQDHTEVVWDVGATVPSPSSVAAFVACHAPYELRGTSLEPRDVLDCAPATAGAVAR